MKQDMLNSQLDLTSQAPKGSRRLRQVGQTVDILCFPVSTGDTVNGTLQMTVNNVMIITLGEAGVPLVVF